jgi:hypothetical protein
MHKKLFLIILLLFGQKTSAYVITTTHHYTYSTPLSQYLVMGEINAFLEEMKYYEDNDIYFALQEFIRLRPFNKREFKSPSIQYALKELHKKLMPKIKQTENQIKHQYLFDYRALVKSMAFLFSSIQFASLTYDLIKKKSPFCSITAACAIVSLPFSLLDLPDAFHPNRDNAYIKKYKNVLKFIKKLQKHDYPNDIDPFFWRKSISRFLMACCLTNDPLASFLLL